MRVAVQNKAEYSDANRILVHPRTAVYIFLTYVAVLVPQSLYTNWAVL